MMMMMMMIPPRHISYYKVTIHYEGGCASDLLSDIEPQPLLSIGPETTMLDAVRKLCLHHIHRMPVVDPESGNMLCMLTHKRLLSYLYNFVSPHFHIFLCAFNCAALKQNI